MRSQTRKRRRWASSREASQEVEKLEDQVKETEQKISKNRFLLAAMLNTMREMNNWFRKEKLWNKLLLLRILTQLDRTRMIMLSKGTSDLTESLSMLNPKTLLEWSARDLPCEPKSTLSS